MYLYTLFFPLSQLPRVPVWESRKLTMHFSFLQKCIISQIELKNFRASSHEDLGKRCSKAQCKGWDFLSLIMSNVVASLSTISSSSMSFASNFNFAVGSFSLLSTQSELVYVPVVATTSTSLIIFSM